MDTVEPGRGIRPVIVNGYIQTDGSTILGSDNKAAISAIICATQEYKTKHGHLPNVELLFTVKEESGGGLEFFPLELIKSKRGIAFDYSRIFGKIIISSPYIYNFKVSFLGRAAHASSPEEGVNSLVPAAKFILKVPQGKLDNNKTTINIGKIISGTGINTIPEKTVVWGEVRSIDKKLFDDYLVEIKNLSVQISKEFNLKIKYSLDGYCPGYNYAETEPFITEISSVYKKMNISTTLDSSTSVSDANILTDAGIMTVNLADGGEHAHSTSERISVKNLSGLQKIVLQMIERFT
jgi:tripeptide aminopeptidase